MSEWTLYPIARFDELAPQWDAVNDAAGGLPFLHSRFITPLMRTFGDDSLTLALHTDSHGPTAAGILRRRGTAQWETFQPSQLPLGAWVMHPGRGSLEPLLESLARALPGIPLVIGVTQQDPECVPRPPETACVRTLDYVQTARVRVSGSFDEYWSQRGKNLRHNMKRQRARLESEGVATRLEILTHAQDVAAAIADYGRLESAGWKAEHGTAVHPDNAQGRFYRTMLESCCAAGVGRIHRYRFGDRVVAVDLCIEGGGALVILKTTYDETITTASPAFLMREEAFKALFEEALVQRIEFFGKLMEWHTRWTDEVRTLYHLNYYRSTLVPKIRDLAAQFGAADAPKKPT